TDKNTAKRIVTALQPQGNYSTVLEVGPGMGVLSDFLFSVEEYHTFLIDIDTESVAFLKQRYPGFRDRIIEGDFLTLDFTRIGQDTIGVIGNFPYNISSQILFKILEERDRVDEVVGMFQREV